MERLSALVANREALPTGDPPAEHADQDQDRLSELVAGCSDRATTVVRTGHAAPDQRGKGKHNAWSVHGGDHFSSFFSSPKQTRRAQKRKVSFDEDHLARPAVVSSVLRPPSVFRNAHAGIAPLEATAEAT